jgi:hypothetical protein
MSFAIGNVASQVSLHAAAEPAAADHSAQPEQPAVVASTGGVLQRQGIIIIGGDVPMHPIVREAAAHVAGESMDGGHKDPIPVLSYTGNEGDGTSGGGFSGLLHTVANLGRGGSQPV